MSKNPFLNALCASLYIVGVVFFIAYVAEPIPEEEGGLMLPIMMLSVFVLSASLMGYLFVFQPAVLFLDGKREEGVKLFLQTIAAFAGITAVIVGSWFFLF